MSQFGSAGSGNGQFNVPLGITIDSSGDIYVTDSAANSRVEEFTLTYDYVIQNGQNDVNDVTIDGNGNVGIDGPGNGLILKSSNVDCFTVKVSNTGALTSTAASCP